MKHNAKVKADSNVHFGSKHVLKWLNIMILLFASYFAVVFAVREAKHGHREKMRAKN